MTLFFPDLNVWLALSDSGHVHSRDAWSWLKSLPGDSRLVFSRYTQIGLLRLLVTPSIMGSAALTVGGAWKVYDRWLEDPQVEFYPEPRDVEPSLRRSTVAFASQKAPKAIGDCWLLACARELNAALVTFDRALHDLSRKQGHTAILPA